MKCGGYDDRQSGWAISNLSLRLYSNNWDGTACLTFRQVDGTSTHVGYIYARPPGETDSRHLLSGLTLIDFKFDRLSYPHHMRFVKDARIIAPKDGFAAFMPAFRVPLTVKHAYIDQVRISSACVCRVILFHQEGRLNAHTHY